MRAGRVYNEGAMSESNILFVCVENACRSQIAQAWARTLGQGRVRAFSAGSKPRGRVDPAAIEVMREVGIAIDGHASKGLDQLPPLTWDAIVTMGCGDACPSLPAKQRIDWQIPDPARQPIAVYRQVRQQIEERVRALLSQLPLAS